MALVGNPPYVLTDNDDVDGPSVRIYWFGEPPFNVFLRAARLFVKAESIVSLDSGYISIIKALAGLL